MNYHELFIKKFFFIFFCIIGIDDVHVLVQQHALICLLKIGVTHSASQILEVWRVIAFNFVTYIVIAGVMLLRLAIKHDVNILDFLKKIYPAYMISFVTGSGSAAIPKNLEVLHERLKIDEKLCHFYIPLSHSLCPVTMLIGIIGYAFFAAEFSGMQISLFQLFIVAFLSIQFAISAVKENGGIIAMMSLLIAQLGLSMDALGMIMAANIFVVNISGVIGLIVRKKHNRLNMLKFKRVAKVARFFILQEKLFTLRI